MLLISGMVVVNVGTKYLSTSLSMSGLWSQRLNSVVGLVQGLLSGLVLPCLARRASPKHGS